MNERQDILKEYFSLVKDLNQTNKFKNEKTQIVFEIEGEIELQLIAKLENGKKYLICHQVRNSIWLPSKSTRYEKLSHFLCREISNYENNKLEIKLTFSEFLVQQLFSLGEI